MLIKDKSDDYWPIFERRITLPPGYVPDKNALQMLALQVKGLYRQALKLARKKRRRLTVRILEDMKVNNEMVERSVKKWVFPSHVDVGEFLAARRYESHYRTLLRELLEVLREVDPERRADVWPVTGRLPDYQEVARWWAKQTFERKSPESIAEEEDPQNEDSALVDRIKKALNRVEAAGTEP